MEDLSPHQEQAIDKAYALLGEHLDSFVLILDTEVDDRRTRSRVLWKGGHMTASGMIEWARNKLRVMSV